MSNDTKEQNKKLHELLLNVIQKDKALREEYSIGDKFRFIRDRLNALLAKVDEHLSLAEAEIDKKNVPLSEDDVLVYVYVFNAQGVLLQTWHKFISQKVFYEYSVNRPIYTDKSAIESFIRSRPNKPQCGYITVAVKKSDILPIPANEVSKDALGNELIKIREGSLHFGKMVSFTHNLHDYVIDKEGQFRVKD